MEDKIIIPGNVMGSALVKIMGFLIDAMSGKIKGGKDGTETAERLVKEIITLWEDSKKEAKGDATKRE